METTGDTPQAKRHNAGKARFDLLPPRPVEDVVRVLTFGASKYGDRNWEQGMPWMGCVASAKRHLSAWEQGQDLDPESGLPHLAHVATNVVFLLEYSRTHPEHDNRPGKGEVSSK